MFKDFAAHYPIRKKFDAILGVMLVITAIPVASNIAGFVSGTSGHWGQLLAELAVMASVGAFILYAKKAICDPYVSTVVCMEGLAAGDLSSPIVYTHHRDCVGRMNKAMLVFKDNAAERARADGVLRTVVEEITSGLQHMKNGNLTYSIDQNFDAEYDALRQNFNDTMNQMCQLLTQTSSAAANVLNGASEIR